MFRLSIEYLAKLKVFALSGLILVLALASAAKGNENTSTGENSVSKRLAEIGMKLEKTRLLALEERQGGFVELKNNLQALLDDNLSSPEKSAAHYLFAEIQLMLGENAEAEELFKKTEKDYKKSPFRDDAAFLRIIAIESDGRDREAAKEWDRWIKKYGDSPLMPEVLTAKCWNEIRRDSLRLAAMTLSRLEKGFSYVDDPRVELAKASIAFLNGQTKEALAFLGDSSDNAAQYFLRGLCYEADRVLLKAAAQYQRIYERYPESGLRDYAMLAKANVFLKSGSYQSAAEEYLRVIEAAAIDDVRAEARVRLAASRFLDGDAAASIDLLREVVRQYANQLYAARAQLLLGEVQKSQSAFEEAILEFNRVLTDYFEHELAAMAQYQVGRCLDALDRHNEATSAYQLVVSGYPLAPQAPAAAYLAGAGLLEQGRPLQAVSYFQLVLDRYAGDAGQETIVFASPEHQELVEAALCLLELSYHRAGDMGQLSGVPHLMLQKMPASNSTWRAYALLIDADALAAQGRYEESQQVLNTLIAEFPEHDIALPANRLLAWTYAQQGKDQLAIQTEERMLARYSAAGVSSELSSAYLNKAHILFNNKQYKEAAAAYDDFFRRCPSHPNRLLSLYQSGLCYFRLQQSGDAVDRWEALVKIDPASKISERAWVRSGDLYFQAEHYDEAKRCYRGLLDNFANSRGTALGMLRLAQCEFNAGQDSEALELYSDVIARFPGTGIAREAKKGMEVALYRLGKSKDGSKVLAELVEKYPSSAFAADAQFEIAMRHYEAKNFTAAAEEFRRVFSQFPDYSSADHAHFLMTESYTEMGELKEAKNGYEQFLMFFPESEFRQTVRFKLGTIRFAEGDFMQAAVEFAMLIEEGAPEEISRASLFNLGLCQKMIGETSEAKATLERYKNKYPKDERVAQLAYQLGDIHEKAGEWDAAAAEYKSALKENPSSELKVELCYRLGVCREELDDIDGALSSYQKAVASKLKSDAYRLSAIVRCAALYEQKGDFKKAITAYQDLVKNSEDRELVVAAQERVAQLQAAVK